MSLICRMPAWLIPLGIAVAVSSTIAALWFSVGPGKSGTASFPTQASALILERYSTLEGLSMDADVVVIGTVNGIVEEGIDRGAERDGPGIPYTVYEVKVNEILKGEPTSTIYVHRYRPGFFVGELTTELTKDETVALYLRQKSNSLSPTISFSTFYTPLAFDNGVFDVSAGGAVGPTGRVSNDALVAPRGVSPNMFNSGSSFRMSELRRAIGAESGEVGTVGSTQ